MSDLLRYGRILLRLIKKRGAKIYSALREVNSVIHESDPWLLHYSWIEGVVRNLATLAIFVGAGTILGKMQGGPASDGVLFLLVLWYVLPLLFAVTFGAWRDARRTIFYQVLWDVIVRRKYKHFTSLDVARQHDGEFLQTRVLADQRGTGAYQRLFENEILGIAAIVVLIVGLITLSVFSVALMLVLFGVAAVQVFFKWRTQAFTRFVDERERQVRRKQSQMRWEMTSHEYGYVMNQLHFTPLLEEYEVQYTGEIQASRRELAWYAFRWTLVDGALKALGLAVFFWFFWDDFKSGSHSLAQLGAILGGFQLVSDALRDFGYAMTQIDHGTLDLAYYQKLLGTRPLIDERHAKPMELRRTPHIEVSNVTFRYPNTEVTDTSAYVLRNCSLSIMPGEKVAFIGHNGSGKTTMANLIGKMYEPQEGSIFIDAYPLKKITQSSWKKQCVFVVQKPRLPELPTLQECLTGEKPERIDHERLKKAMEYGRVEDIVASIPLGLKTPFGQQWEHGRDFSAGQYQRFVLTRVFYYLMDPSVRIVIFDEPMAHCDDETRTHFYNVVGGMHGHFPDKTFITIHHEPEELSQFRRTVKFENGKVVRDVEVKDNPISAARTA